jgi:hypothetical protein
LGVELAPLPLEEPNTSLPAGRCEVVDGTGVLAEPLGAVLLDAAGVDVELVTLEPDELECLAGFPSNRLPVPVKKLTFGSSTGGAPAGIHKPNTHENGKIQILVLVKSNDVERESCSCDCHPQSIRPSPSFINSNTHH